MLYNILARDHPLLVAAHRYERFRHARYLKDVEFCVASTLTTRHFCASLRGCTEMSGFDRTVGTKLCFFEIACVEVILLATIGIQ